MLLQEYFPRDLKHHVVTFYQFSWPYFLRGNALFQGISSFAFYEKIIFFPPSFTFFWLLLCNTSGSYFGGAKTNGFLISDFPSEMEFHLANLCSYTKFFAILVSSRPAQPTSRLLRPITMASRLVICATTKLAKVPISVLEELCRCRQVKPEICFLLHGNASEALLDSVPDLL